MDPQQELVYDWEDSFTLWAGAHLTERQARKLIRDACNKYRVPVPTIFFLGKDRGARGKVLPSSYEPISHVIRIRPRHLNSAVILHETAHAITDYILEDYEHELESHGAEFVGVYMCLLEDFKICPLAALHASAEDAGVRFRKRHLVGPQQIRKRNRARTRSAKKLRKALKQYGS
jgi:hypothetical protein